MDDATNLPTTPAIVKRLEKLRQRHKAIVEVAEAASQLPLWPEERRGLPNALARTALFSAAETGDRREFLPGVEVASLSNITLHFRGEELRQDDASVFMQICHLARTQTLGTTVYFTGYSMLKALGWSLDSRQYERLRNCIERLKGASVKSVMTQAGKRTAFSRSLIRGFDWRDEESDTPLKQWKVLLEPEIIRLFAERTYTLIEWDQRRKIDSRSTLALWLHSFLATHEEPIPIGVQKYHQLSGSTSAKLFHFRDRLRRALKTLEQVGFLASWRIDPKSDLVYLHRALRSPTKQKQLGHHT